jgi:putative membrane protein
MPRFNALLIAATLVVAPAPSAFAAVADQEFVTKAADGGMTEVKLGALAQKNGHSARVKAFGAQMVKDHGEANKELKALAAKLGATVPTKISAKHQATYDKLAKLKGEAFDTAYLDDMVKDHKMDVAEFEKEAKSGKTPQVKAWAAEKLPTLKMHLQQIKQVAAKVGVDAD